MVLLEIIRSLFALAWSLFTGVTVPGLGVPFSALFLGFLLAQISISIYHHATGTGGTGYRSDSARNPKISDNRKGDQF